MKKEFIKIVIFVFFVTFFLIVTDAYSEIYTTYPENKGPLSTTNIYPFYIPFINLRPEGGKTLGEGNLRISITNNYANTFNFDLDGLNDGFELDMDVETYQLTVAFDYGLTDWLDIGIDGSYVIQYGGIFDPVINAFHDIFGLADAGREEVSNNQFKLAVINNNGTWFDLTEPVSGLCNITLRARINLISSKTNNLYISVQPALKIPLTGTDQFLSNDKIDYGISLLMERTLKNWAFYGNLGWMHFGKPDDLVIFDFNEDQLSYMIAIEWIISDNWSLYIQADGNTSPYESGNKRLDKQSGTINLGFKTRLDNSAMLQVSFAEEFFTYATTDIAIIMALTVDF